MISSVMIENDSVTNNKKKNGKNIMNPELTENRGQAEEQEVLSNPVYEKLLKMLYDSYKSKIDFTQRWH